MAELETSRARRVLYSVGAIAYGVKDNGFTTFLMIYFNQVLGLSAFYTGLAILIALAVDAISDPYVGHLSDRWKSKMGRRHPFMYFSIIPIAITYYLLWNVPGELSNLSLFAYLTAMAILVRLCITFFEVPNSAMVAELSRGYDQRTALSGMRITFGWIGGVAMAVVAYVVFLVPTDDISNGLLNGQGYRDFAVLGALVMVISMLVSAMGTHKLISRLPQPKHQSRHGARSFRENLKDISSNKSFRSLFVAALFAMMAFGIIITLQIYYANFFFGLNNEEISLFPMVMALAAVLSMILTPIISKGREKKSVLKFLVMSSLVLSNITIVLRLVGWLPENGDPLLLPLLLVHILVSTTILVALQAVYASMAADLVEDTERQTGHRVEGLYFAAISFSKKIVSGLGIFISGVLLSSASGNSSVMNAESMTEVSYIYVPTICLLYLLTYIFTGKYELSREDHEANLVMVRSS